jgi:membrane protein implicated in regulation of membrane protease activity
MEGVGWEIQTAGWVLLFLVAALLIYFVVKWLRRPPDENQQKP